MRAVKVPTQPNLFTKEARRRWLLVGLPVLAIVAATLYIFSYAREAERETVRARFEQRSAELAGRIERSLAAYTDEVYALRSFYDSSTSVERDEFRSFVQDGLARRPALQALEWVPRVPQASRAAFERAARAEGLDLTFRRWAETGSWEASQEAWAQDYFPVYYVEPLAGNEKALGIDLASHPARRAALEQAWGSGELTLTESVQLAQETENQAGVLMLLPVYEDGPVSTAETRRELKGFALGVLRIGDVVSSALKGLPHKDILVRVVDRSAGAETLLFSEAATPEEAAFRTSSSQELGGRVWEYRFLATPGYLAAQRSWQPWLILLTGALLAALVAFLQSSATLRTFSVERQVAERTAELRSANRRLTETAEKLERSNIELKQFAYVASHDLQTPLRTIGGFVSLLKRKYDGQLGEEADDYIGRIVKGTQTMQALLHDLLEYARFESTMRPMVQVDLNEVFGEVVQTSHAAIQDAQAVVTSSELPTILGDRIQLIQLLQNLIGNALTYRGDEPPRINVTAEADAACWTIAVQDNGIGIAQKHFGRIFEVFRRLHTQDQYAGTGLGLATCRRIVERHGGKLWLTSQVGEGSTFFFSVPKGGDDEC